MFLMCPDTLPAPIPTDRQTGEAGADGAWAEDPALLLRRRLDELQRLRAAGMGIAETMHGWLDGSVSDAELGVVVGRRGVVSEFCRVARAVRQVIALELELTGLRPAPDRDAVREPHDAASEHGKGHWRLRDDLNDYDNGPLDQVVARVRKAVRLEAPADDPFAPPEMRRARAVARNGGPDRPEHSGGTAVAECRAGSGDASAPSTVLAPAPSPSRRKATGPSPGSRPGHALSRGAGEGNYDGARNRGPPG
jgi:hypothetical protein